MQEENENEDGFEEMDKEQTDYEVEQMERSITDLPEPIFGSLGE